MKASLIQKGQIIERVRAGNKSSYLTLAILNKRVRLFNLVTGQLWNISINADSFEITRNQFKELLGCYSIDDFEIIGEFKRDLNFLSIRYIDGTNNYIDNQKDAKLIYDNPKFIVEGPSQKRFCPEPISYYPLTPNECYPKDIMNLLL